MAIAPILKHQHTSLPHYLLVNNLIGHSVMLTTLAPATSRVTQKILATRSPQSSGFLIQTFQYSYDGIVHIESYVSDL